MQKKTFDMGHKLRAMELGQDRFRRRWVSSVVLEQKVVNVADTPNFCAL